jgi:hypothetical protein
MITDVFIGNGTFVDIPCQAANLTLKIERIFHKSAYNRRVL